MINTVIFDLDNTLVNRKRAIETFSEKFIDHFIDIPNPADKPEIVRYFIEADQDGYRGKKVFFQDLLENLKWKKEAAYQELLDYWEAEFYVHTQLMDGAEDVLQFLKSRGLTLGLITNGTVYAQNFKIDHVGIRHWFDSIVVSDEVQVNKPDRKIFEIALERLEARPEASVYIGDHPLNDMKGAQDAGLKTIWLEGFRVWDLPDVQPHRKIRDLRELIQIFGED